MDSLRNLWKRSNQFMPLLAGASFVLVIGVTSIAVLCDGTINPAEGETCAQCVREWVGALSGWGAVLAAFVTVWMIKNQITQTHLLSEQSRLAELSQTASERGDAMLRVSTAMTFIADEAEAIKNEGSGRYPYRFSRIEGVRGLQAIEARKHFLRSANIENTQAVIEEIGNLKRAVNIGNEKTVSKAALSLQKSCQVIGQAIESSANHQIEVGHQALEELALVRAKLSSIGGN